MRFRRFEVVLIRIDFHQASGFKVPPAVVLLDTGDDDFVAAPVTLSPDRLNSILRLQTGARRG
jgi:hypothetical protein